jgi:glycosyltransferase involved in cell wall biosynthesis
MKVGIDIRNIGKKRTGDEAVFFNLVKNLAEIDNTNEYFLFSDIADATILRNMVVEPLGIENKNNFKVICLECPNKFIWNAWTLPKYLRKNPVDIYHTQYILPFFISHKTKLITTIHDISFNFFPQHINWKDLFFLKMLIPRSLRKAAKIIAVSEFTKNEIAKYYKVNPEKIEVVYNSIGDNFLKKEYTAEELENVRKKYNLPEKFMLYIGTLQPRKNLTQLIEVHARIKDKLPDLKLVIAGKRDHNYDEKIDGVISKHDLSRDTMFAGFVDESDKSILFYLSHFFVMPSLYEGFGIPVLEAMSQAVPVAASNIPSLKEVAGEAAAYFDPRDLANMEKILYNISIDENLRSKLINLGFARLKFFSWKKSAEKILTIYQGLEKI